MNNKALVDGYIPYGIVWENELMKLPKKILIDMIRKIKTDPHFQNHLNDQAALSSHVKTKTAEEITQELKEMNFITPINVDEIYLKGFDDGYRSSQINTKELESKANVDDGWIEIKEGCEMPMKGKNVFAFCGGIIMVMAWEFIEAVEYSGMCWCNCYGDIKGDAEFDDNYFPTHWMPLPKPPTI